MAHQSVLVVGGGIVGRSVAYALAKRGVDVQLIEAGQGCSVTTTASLGILTHFNGSDSPYSDLYRDAHDGYREVVAQLLELTGVDTGFTAQGGIDLVFDDGDAEKADELFRFNQARGCSVERLDSAQVKEAEPNLREDVRGGLYYPEDQRVDPERLAESLRLAILASGGLIEFGESLIDVLRSNEEGVTLQTNRRHRSADYLVLAAGCWSGRLGSLFGSTIAVRPVRGQHCRFNGPAVNHVLRHADHQLINSSQQVIVGATTEEVGFDASVTTEAANAQKDHCHRVLKGESHVAEQRAGLRPKPKGGRPMIGPLEQHPRVFVATGHYKNGILLGPITGQLVAECIIDGQFSRDMSWAAVER